MSATPDYDLDAPGWVLIAGDWRWTGVGKPPKKVPCRSGHSDCTVDCGWCKGTGYMARRVTT